MTDKKVDEGWKKRAAEEKEGSEEPVDEAPFPEATLSTFLNGLATQVLLSLGEMESPGNTSVDRNLSQAKYSIDLLQIIKEKTAGNLTEDEQKYLDAILYDLRMRYVEACR